MEDARWELYVKAGKTAILPSKRASTQIILHGIHEKVYLLDLVTIWSNLSSSHVVMFTVTRPLRHKLDYLQLGDT